MSRPTFNPDSGGAAQSSTRENPVVGGFRSRNSAYYRPPPGDPSQWGYSGGAAIQQYVQGTRADAVTGHFNPYRSRDRTSILNSISTSRGIVDLQLALIRAGFLDDDVRLGYIDSKTEDAFSDVLAVANQNGMVWQDVLSQAGEGAFSMTEGVGGGGRELGPEIVTLPNRDDLKASLNDTGWSLTGQVLDDDLLDGATESVLDQLRTQQERQYQSELGAADGSLAFVEGSPESGRLLEEEIRERAPGLVMSKGVRDAMDDWFAALGGPV